jgi:hypothetical protein
VLHACACVCAARFPHESSGIKSFYDECWAVFNALNSLEMKSLEEPRCVCVWGGCLGAVASFSSSTAVVRDEEWVMREV